MARVKFAYRIASGYRRTFRMLESAGASRQRIVYAAILAPVLFAAAFVYFFGVNVIYGDQWEMVTYFSRLSNDNLFAANLWMPHNEHRFFFPRMVMLTLGSLSGWNHLLEMYVVLLCLLLVLATLAVAFGRDIGSRRLVFFVPVAFMVFSLKQWTNLLWGYQITFALTLAATVCALFLLDAAIRDPNGRGVKTGLFLATAIVAAVVAAGSSIQGLLVFPAGIVQFFLFSGRDFRWKEAGIWGVSGAAVWLFYFQDYNPRNNTPSSLAGVLSEPFATARYFLSILGNSLYSQPRILIFVGFFLIVLLGFAAVLVWISGDRRSYAFWFSLAAFSILTLFLVTVGRGGIGIESAFASRYTTFSIIGVASLYVILLKLLVEKESWQRHALFGAAAVTIFLSLPLSFATGMRAGIAERENRERAVRTLLDHRNTDDASLRSALGFPGEGVRKRAVILERLEYSSFSDEPTDGR